MRPLLFAALMLSHAFASAEVYKCPQVYPGKDKPAAPLTGAAMRQVEPSASGHMMDDEAAEEGYDEHFAFYPEEQTWLICFYGGTRRVKGRFHDGHEWNQRMESADFDWEMKLAPGLSKCTVQTRELKTRGPGKSTWTVTAICEKS
jgi:hypothetical protein